MNTQSDKSDFEADENLSSFIDGELRKDHCETLINSLCRDEGMKSCLDRYQLISDAIRRKLPRGINRNFIKSVMSAIESEPTILSPSRSSSRMGFSSSFSKKVAGFAIAASVATIAIVSVQMKNSEDPQKIALMPESSEFVRLANEPPVVASNSQQPVLVPQTGNGFSNASTIVGQQELLSQGTVKGQPLTQEEALQNIRAQLLHQYVLDHIQYASGSGVYDVIPHSRIVASTQQQDLLNQVQR